MSTLKRVSSKWAKTKVLIGSPFLSAHIPTTRRLTRKSLKRLLAKYGLAYVKPEEGSLGIGVMRVGRRSVQEGLRKRTFASYDEMYEWLRKRTAGKSYLAQRGVRMLKLQGRPIDFRVMVQKGRAGWKVTGTAARVAHPGKVVTNGSQGGSIHDAGGLLRRLTDAGTAIRLQRKFKRLAKATAWRFQNAYPRMNELGLDIAVDRKRRAWILEVNTQPDPCPFTKLADASMLNEIIRYARGYGKTYALNCTKARRG
ncbi:YheC/YheD family protein [Cohnella suwonensis]|uniref:YheC/YheD family protein n=1 Tax=Cohnella suwonensis TaxID=696072 RepID=A0ABW0LNQ2_9BACL